jgi:hypothetical protein
MARIKDIVVDCAQPAPLARFWVAVLEDYSVAPYGEEDLAALRAQGIEDPEDDPSVLVLPGPGGGPRLWFTKVPEPKTVKNRVHLDLSADDPAAELARLTGLGARVIWETDTLTVLEDPEGNEFCLLKRD